jgi:uncharacterized membrane protein
MYEFDILKCKFSQQLERTFTYLDLTAVQENVRLLFVYRALEHGYAELLMNHSNIVRVVIA